MPIYEYGCPKCGHFELVQKFSDPALKRCPTCKGKVAKLMSNTSFQLKGTGWYATDYARKGPTSGASNGGSTETKGDSAKPPAKESSKAKDGAASAA
ncbi:MAG: zinc ribbon domain-containing protein [Deltaproteobacteria bacterium]|nr:zinc ribbon domain-containing protein [Deltaproteobacteria bacterium]